MRLVVICEAVFPENKGGLERWFQTLTENIARNGNEVVYLNASGINEVRNGVSYVSITSSNWFYLSGGVRSIRQSIEFAVNVFKFLKENEYDGIYCAQAPIFPIFATTLVKMYKKRITIIEWFEIWPLKYWIRYRGVLIGIAGWSIQLIASQFGTYLTVFTPRAKGALKRLRLGRDKRIRILCGLISQKDLMKNNECERTDIIFLGRLVGEKQPHLAIEAVKMYLEKGWNGEFWLIGQGPLGNELLNKVDSARLNKNIHVIQNATDDFVESKMCKSFLLIHPSRREGYGISIVEAATLGVPALIIDYPDNAAVELQINPKLISKSDNPRELMSLIEYADSNQLELRSESLKWIQKASVNQTMDKSSEQVVRLFEIFRPSH